MTALAPAEFSEHLRSFESTAFRLELQRQYREPGEPQTVARFLAGDPQAPTEVPGLRQWFAQVADLSSRGKRIERVRVHDEPPTGYQRWERWIDRWNIEAGETIHYLTRDVALQIGLLPPAGNVDWWLLDSNRLIVMRFDERGNRIHNELVVDPTAVAEACSWRDLAVQHSTWRTVPGVAP